MLSEAKRLYDLGFAIHWLKPGRKEPVEAGWTKGPRADWKTLKEKYKPGYNIGVRLGKASKLEGGFLAVVDCDVKSKDPRHLKEMHLAVSKLGVLKDAPMVTSGRGNGSKHFYVKTPEPVSFKLLERSKDTIKVKMPGSSPSKREAAELSKEELKAGIRLRPAWEVAIMGQGQQVVLPPSIHPDTKKPYKWAKSVTGEADIPVKEFSHSKASATDDVVEDFTPEDVDLTFSNLSDDMVALIVEGENCEDRSASLFKVSMAMVKEGFTVNQIKSVLTNCEYFLGGVAFEHAKTNSRKRAAEWVEKYTLKKAKREATFEEAFDEEVIEEPVKLDEKQSAEQARELVEYDWRNRLQRNKPTDPPRPTFQNIKLILENTLELEPFIARNDFSIEDIWTADAPWGTRSGQVVKDDDSVLIKEWLGKTFRVEPARDKIEEVLIWFAIQNRFHPVREYLDGLKWDGKPRLSTWLKSYLNAEGPKEYLKAVGEKTLLAMVARIYEPGCKFDNVLILEGEQGIGKSSTARILAGDEWFSDSDLNIGDKDAVVNMQGIWVYELGELSAMSRYDVNRLKEFISRSTDKIRPPYGKRALAYPRQSIFIGTTNNTEYLKDKTGNRRYWPVKVGKVRMEALKRDRDQLLAEAVEKFLEGDDIWIRDGGVLAVVQHEQGLRVEHDEIEDLLGEFLNEPGEVFPIDQFRTQDLFTHAPCLAGMKNDKQGQMRVTNALKGLGFERTQKMVNGTKGMWWQKRTSTPRD